MAHANGEKYKAQSELRELERTTRELMSRQFETETTPSRLVYDDVGCVCVCFLSIVSSLFVAL